MYNFNYEGREVKRFKIVFEIVFDVFNNNIMLMLIMYFEVGDNSVRFLNLVFFEGVIDLEVWKLKGKFVIVEYE